MKMKKLLLLLAFLITTQAIGQKQTVITGEIFNRSNYDQRVVKINYLDPIVNIGSVSVKLSPDGRFKSRYEMWFAQNITIHYEDYRIDLFINPSDSVHISIDMEKFRKGDSDGIMFSGDGAGVNNQFAATCKYINQLQIPSLNLLLPSVELLASMKKIIDNNCDSLYQFGAENDITPIVLEWGRRDIIYSVSAAAANYARRDYNQKLEVMTDSIFDLYNNNNFQTAKFQSHVKAILNPLLMASDTVRNYLRSGDVERGSLAAVGHLCSLPESYTRDFMIYMLLAESISAVPSIYEKLDSDIFTNGSFYKRLGKIYDKSSNLKFEYTPISGVTYLNIEAKKQAVAEQDFFEFLKTEYAGYVLYIDVWATWCVPCCKQFAPAKELHRIFKSKDVIFINLCLSSQLEEWQPTMLKHNVMGENYFFNNDASAVFMETYKLSGYPSYIIMDKKGKIITKSAPSPSNLQNAIRAIEVQLNK